MPKAANTSLLFFAFFILATCVLSQADNSNIPTISDSLKRGTIVVDANGTKLSYIDSGRPHSNSYTTIFAVHGMAFNANIFTKIQSLASTSDFRIVAINRRGYAGSTTYTNAELQVILNGTDSERDELYKATGMEILTFIDVFIKENDIPSISPDGKSGGIALIGWSIGNMAALSAIAHVGFLPNDARVRLASRMRTLIMQEPSSNALGLPLPAQTWLPLHVIDPTIPAAVQYPAFVQWVTAYFDHGNLSSRDTSAISWVLPSISKPFSVFSMSSKYNLIVDTGDNPGIDVAQLGLVNQLKSNYMTANFNKTIRGMLPKMKNWFITGDKSASFGPYALWLVQDDNQAQGGGFVDFRYIHGVNHFMHWDVPSVTLQVYHDLINK